MRITRVTLYLAVAAFLQTTSAVVFAQGSIPPPPPPPPPKLEPLPEIPPPPGVTAETDLEPQVTIAKKEGETVEQARVNGRLVWVKVTPRHGKPYFLIPDGDGNVAIRRDSLDTGLKVPLWLLLEF